MNKKIIRIRKEIEMCRGYKGNANQCKQKRKPFLSDDTRTILCKRKLAMTQERTMLFEVGRVIINITTSISASVY